MPDDVTVKVEGRAKKTGSTSDRVLFGVYQDDERIAAVVAGVTYSLLSEIGVPEGPGLLHAIEHVAPGVILREHDAATLHDRERIDGAYEVDLSTYNTSDEERAELVRHATTAEDD